jgi:protein-tyrosine phosphatase
MYCLGNICRSPMAESIFKNVVRQKGFGADFKVDSAGTAGYHIGKQPDRRTLEVLMKNGLASDHIVQKLGVEDFEKFDHIVVMDEENFEFVHQLYHKSLHRPPAPEKVFLIRDHDPEVRGVQEVPDPYSGGKKEFEEVYNILNRSCEVLVDYLAELHDLSPSDEEE